MTGTAEVPVVDHNNEEGTVAAVESPVAPKNPPSEGPVLEQRKFNVLDPEAFQWYKTPGKGHPAPRHFLRFDYLGAVADALGRSLLLPELKLLFRTDGTEMCKCPSTQKQFMPVRWFNINNAKFLEGVAQFQNVARALEEVKPLEFGCYFIARGELETTVAFSGGAWYWQNGSYVLDAASALVQARAIDLEDRLAVCATERDRKLCKPHWGETAAEADAHLRRIKQAIARRREEEKRRLEEATRAALGSRRPRFNPNGNHGRH